MSEKQQRTAASMREKMLNRYGDNLHHKHNKNHHLYRKHCRSHPVQTNGHTSQNEENENENASTGLIRAFKLRKMRKRLDKGRIH